MKLIKNSIKIIFFLLMTTSIFSLKAINPQANIDEYNRNFYENFANELKSVFRQFFEIHENESITLNILQNELSLDDNACPEQYCNNCTQHKSQFTKKFFEIFLCANRVINQLIQDLFAPITLDEIFSIIDNNREKIYSIIPSSHANHAIELFIKIFNIYANDANKNELLVDTILFHLGIEDKAKCWWRVAVTLSAEMCLKELNSYGCDICKSAFKDGKFAYIIKELAAAKAGTRDIETLKTTRLNLGEICFYINQNYQNIFNFFLTPLSLSQITNSQVENKTETSSTESITTTPSYIESSTGTIAIGEPSEQCDPQMQIKAVVNDLIQAAANRQNSTNKQLPQVNDCILLPENTAAASSNTQPNQLKVNTSNYFYKPALVIGGLTITGYIALQIIDSKHMTLITNKLRLNFGKICKIYTSKIPANKLKEYEQLEKAAAKDTSRKGQLIIEIAECINKNSSLAEKLGDLFKKAKDEKRTKH